MPTVKIVVSERVTYAREVEMTEAEVREWDDKLDLSGQRYDRALEDFASRYIRRDDRDFFDADDLELGEFTTVEATAEGEMMDTDPNSWDANVQYLLDQCPYTVWQRPGAGPVDLLATLVVTFMGMQMRLDSHSMYTQPDKA